MTIGACGVYLLARGHPPVFEQQQMHNNYHPMTVVVPCCSTVDLVNLLVPRVQQRHCSHHPSPPLLRRRLDQQAL